MLVDSYLGYKVKAAVAFGNSAAVVEVIYFRGFHQFYFAPG
jgi:hypothetical protein